MLTFPAHLILTLRTKTAYEVQESQNGKKVPVKIGLAPVQRDGVEYEFTTILEMSVEGNLATSSKDRTGLFMDKLPFKPSEETGKILKEWLQTGLTFDQLLSDLREDAVLHQDDLKRWYKGNLLRIKMLPQEKQGQLIEEIKAETALTASAASRAVGLSVEQAGMH
jgi:hypothetical protein